eukprot:scaffold10334_cov54-Cyclotella_meneghiniana.AAC.1
MSCLLTQTVSLRSQKGASPLRSAACRLRSGSRQSAEGRGCWARPCSLLTPNGPIQNSFFSLRTWHYLHVEAFESWGPRSWGLETAAADFALGF